MMCDVSIQPVVSGVIMQAVEVSACARSPFGETMRSPFAGNSYNMRLVDYTGGVGGAYGSISGAFGVRPALLSEKLCVRRTQVTHNMCAVLY